MNNKNTAHADSYLSFRLATETFAVSVTQILEILEVPPITKVPQSPAYMRGVINLRGAVLPVIDTRIKFGLPAAEYTVHTCIVVLALEVEGETLTVGTLVDSVQAVLEVSPEQILPSPSIGSKYRSEFITGIIRQEDDFLMLLDVNRVFSTDDFALLSETEEKTV